MSTISLNATNFIFDMKAISLFSGGGIGDLALGQAGFKVVVANEILEDRAEVFRYNYPDTNMIIGQIIKNISEILDTTNKILK